MMGLEYLTPVNVLEVIVIVMSAFIATKIIEIGFIRPQKDTKKDRRAVIPLKRVSSILIYVIAFVLILIVLDIDITAAAAGLGIGAIVIGFGLKDIVSNWISGIIIIVERIYRIDDVIRVGNITGTVTDISLRSTRLKTYDRNEVIIPNSMMINEKIINLTAGRNELISSIFFSIDYTSSIEEAKKIIEEVLRKEECVPVDKERGREVRFIVRTKEWTTEIEALFWINKPKEEEFIKSRIIENVKKEFEKKNILPPVPAGIREDYLKSKK